MVLSEIIQKGWKETKKSFWFFVLVIIIYFGLIELVSFILRKLIISDIGAFIIILIVYVWLTIGLVIISLKKAKGEATDILDLFRGYPYLASSMGATLLYFLMVCAGLFLLIFPGVIWGVKYAFYQYFIVDKKMKALDALKASGKMTLGIKWDLLGIFIVLNIIEILGFLALIIGIFWAFPVALIASAVLYLKLVGRLKQNT